MSVPQTAVERPTSVTVAIVIGWISVLMDVLAGVGLLLLAGNADVTTALDADEGLVRTQGIVALVVAAILAIVVYLLSQGSTISRMLVTIVMVVRIGFAIWAMFAFGTHQLAEAIVSAAIGITAIVLLWNDKANAFFAANK